jgi:hypothetical protein
MLFILLTVINLIGPRFNAASFVLHVAAIRHRSHAVFHSALQLVA